MWTEGFLRVNCKEKEKGRGSYLRTWRGGTLDGRKAKKRAGVMNHRIEITGR